MQDDFFVYGIDFEFGQNMVVQEFHAVEDGELIPNNFVFRCKVITAGFEGVRAGGGVYHDGIFAMLRPVPHLHEGFMECCLICGFVSFRRERHSAAVTGGVGWDM